MNTLEKILKEIEEATFQEEAPIYVGDMEVDGYVRESVVKDIIRSHMDDDKDTNVPTNGGWIPVSEQLPETDEMVLVTCKTKKGLLSVNRAYYLDDCWHGSGSMSGVIAWQPLPEPHKGE